jgi:phosphoribosylformylglycinamidine cyclo-ligase
MPAVYPPGHFDLAGAVIGVVEEAAIVDGSCIQEGDILLGFPSAGLHTNGYSLVQRLFSDAEYRRFHPALGRTLGEALLEPHRSYRDVIRQLPSGAVHGLAHITGGGIAGNLSRILPDGMRAVVHLPPPPPLFALIEAKGVPREEMMRVFNMGIGLIAVCDRRVMDELPEGALCVGRIESGERGVIVS